MDQCFNLFCIGLLWRFYLFSCKSESEVMWASTRRTLTEVVLHPSMAFDNIDSLEEADECPVCYESLSGTDRTLSCGHVFCHDCLVKTLLSISTDGNIRDNIVCPICQHLTFLKKQKEELLSNKSPGEIQTLEVPLPVPVPQPERSQRIYRYLAPRGTNWLANCFRGISKQVRRHKLVGSNHKACQIFIISTEGRPMNEDDESRVVTSVAQQQHMQRCRICTSPQCITILLSTIVLMALTALILSLFPFIEEFI